MTSKTFLNYLSEANREYRYTIKLAVPSIDDNMLDCLEQALQKYCLKSAQEFKATPVQECPLDFPNIRNMPVYSSEIVLLYPSSLAFLQTLVANHLKISTGQVAVFSENDPLQIERDLFIQRTSDEYKDNYTPTLGSEYPADTDKPQYGDEYNAEFLKSLAAQRANRPLNITTNSLLPDQVFDPVAKEYHTYTQSTGANRPTLFGRTKLTNIKEKK